MKRKASNTERSDTPKRSKQPWTMGLLQTMKDPKCVVKSDDTITMIKDMYPKARHHYLVLPNADISSLKSVKLEHVPLLKHMEQGARSYIEENHSDSTFLLGYHAEPSMHRLHLHVISDDMDSGALKTKKHWNSFTTQFLLEPGNVIKDLQETGKVTVPGKEECEKLLGAPLKCHKCEVIAKNMPQLKKHIKTHIISS